MDGRVRNLYPGGNTPDGFYSYYNYILPQREAEKIFCIKMHHKIGNNTQLFTNSRKTGAKSVKITCCILCRIDV